jgi:hypothetical protein
MHIERVNSAYRLGFLIAFLYLLWKIGPTLAPHVRTYFDVVATNAHRSRTTAVEPEGKLSPRQVESILQANQFQPNAQLRCEAADPKWDYVCTYLTVQYRTKVQFGVTVDATRLLRISRVVPIGTDLPPPQ